MNIQHNSPSLETKSAAVDDFESEVKHAIEDFTTTATQALDKTSREVSNLGKRFDGLELRLGRMNLTGGDPTAGDIAPELKALSTYIRTDDDGELKAMSVGSDPAGGYLVLPVMGPTFTKKLFDQSAIRRLARVQTISAGDAWEEVIDADDVNATWIGEKDSRPADTNPTLGKLRVAVNEIYALQSITQRLIDDSSFDVGAWVNEKVTDKFGRAEGDAFINGDGVARPRGLLTYTNVTTSDTTRAQGQLQYVKTGGAAGFAASNPADKLIQLVYSLRAPYKNDGNAAFLMNSSTASTVRQFKDSQGRYIWSEGMTEGQPPSLLGYPVELDENMQDLGSNTFPIAFGNFKLGYLIVDKAGIKFLRDPYASKPNVLFYFYRRVGGGLANSEAIKLLKCEA